MILPKLKTTIFNKIIPGFVFRRFRDFLFQPKEIIARQISDNPYLFINNVCILGLIIFFAYFLIFPANANYPIQSIAGQNLTSTGLSRAFSELVRFRFTEAFTFNQYIFQVAGFFIFQFVFRIIALILLTKTTIAKNKLLSIDIILSVLLLLCGFGNMVYHQVISLK